MPSPVQESFADMQFPLKGVDVSKGFGAQQPGTTPVGRNVRGYEPASKRAKGGGRPGLAKYLAAQLPSGAHLIQNLNIVDPSNDSALLSNVFDWPGLPAGGVQDPAIPSVPLPPVPPISIPAFGAFPALTWQWDTSTPGFGPGHTATVTVNGQPVTVPVPSDWGSTTAGQGIQSRNPGRIIPVGGSGATPTKNKTKKLTPTINWFSPIIAPLGTPLSAVQLNATATDPNTSLPVFGTFTYRPPAGTKTTTDPQSLYVLFTPNDLSKYTINTATAVIQTVLPISLVQFGVTTNTLFGVTSGNLLVAFFTTLDSAGGNGIPPPAVSTITDSLGSNWSLAAEILGTPYASPGPNTIQIRTSIWYAVAGATNNCLLTVTGTSAFFNGDLRLGILAEWTNTDTNSPLAATITNEGASSAATTGAMAPVSANDVAMGVFCVEDKAFSPGNASLTPGAGMTALASLILYVIPAAQSQALSGTVGNLSGLVSPYFQCVGAIFKHA